MMNEHCGTVFTEYTKPGIQYNMTFDIFDKNIMVSSARDNVKNIMLLNSALTVVELMYDFKMAATLTRQKHYLPQSRIDKRTDNSQDTSVAKSYIAMSCMEYRGYYNNIEIA